MQESIVFLLRVQCRRKESLRSLSHLLMSFLSILYQVIVLWNITHFCLLALCTHYDNDASHYDDDDDSYRLLICVTERKIVVRPQLGLIGQDFFLTVTAVGGA